MDAKGGILVLGGGFAGSYVARLLGRVAVFFRRDIAELEALGHTRGLRDE